MSIARHSLFLSVMIVTVMLAAGPARATEEFCVVYEGIDGGPPTIPCPGMATVGLEYHHLVARDVSGGPPGPPQHYLVIFTKSLDKATPALWEKLDTGDAILSVTFTFRAGPPLQESDFIITLANARVIGIEPIVAHASDTNQDIFGNQERVRMNYESMTIENVQDGTSYTITP